MKNYIVILETGVETDSIRRMIIQLRAEDKDKVREIVESTLFGNCFFFGWRLKRVIEGPSEASRKHRELFNSLAALRAKRKDGQKDPGEDAIRDEMETLWWKMSEDERKEFDGKAREEA